MVEAGLRFLKTATNSVDNRLAASNCRFFPFAWRRVDGRRVRNYMVLVTIGLDRSSLHRKRVSRPYGNTAGTQVLASGTRIAP